MAASWLAFLARLHLSQLAEQFRGAVKGQEFVFGLVVFAGILKGAAVGGGPGVCFRLTFERQANRSVVEGGFHEGVVVVAQHRVMSHVLESVAPAGQICAIERH